jgi:catalase
MTQAKKRSAQGNLTTRQGHPVEDNQSSRTIGSRGRPRWRTTT